MENVLPDTLIIIKAPNKIKGHSACPSKGKKKSYLNDTLRNSLSELEKWVRPLKYQPPECNNRYRLSGDPLKKGLWYILHHSWVEPSQLLKIRGESHLQIMHLGTS